MLPLEFDPSTVSSAEKKLFHLLKNDPNTSDWTAIHSLGLAKRGRKPYGEIDFVVLIPANGLFCIEVKGGRVACKDGVWTTTAANGKTERLSRSPFLQAREGMFSLRQSLLNGESKLLLESVMFGYAVAFPDIDFEISSPEWESWQVIDRTTLLSPISKTMQRLSKEQKRLLCISGERELTQDTIRIIKQLLRPDFEIVVTRTAQVTDTEARLLKLTEEQFDCLDTLDANDRCLIEGAAGTGKTVIAMEFARRSAISGRKTLFICFNQILGDWIAQRIADYGLKDLIVAGRYFQFLRRVILDSNSASAFQEAESKASSDQLFGEVMPFFALQVLENSHERYDQLIVDEGQDLMNPSSHVVWSALLNGGLRNGRWAIFGDFCRQAIYGRQAKPDEMKDALTRDAGFFTRVILQQNCRNTRNIATETAFLSGFDKPPYRMGEISGLPVDYRYYDSPQQEEDILRDVIRRLLSEGMKPSDIIVLSKNKSLSFSLSRQNYGFEILPLEIRRRWSSPKPVYFTTIHSFKGMESPVIIMCDVDQVIDNEPQSLLYVGMSRARSLLVILISESVRPLIRERIRREVRQLGT